MPTKEAGKTGQAIPWMKAETSSPEVPKFVPVMVMRVPVEPRRGETRVTFGGRTIFTVGLGRSFAVVPKRKRRTGRE